MDAWRELIEAFVGGRMDAASFETAYVALYSKAAAAGLSIPYAADLLFYEVDAYCGDPELRGSEDIDDAQLLGAARKALEEWHRPWPPVSSGLA